MEKDSKYKLINVGLIDDLPLNDQANPYNLIQPHSQHFEDCRDYLMELLRDNMDVLTPTMLGYLTEYLGGKNRAQISREHGVHRSTVIRSIFGDFRKGELHQAGAVQHLQKMASSHSEIQMILVWLKDARLDSDDGGNDE